MYADAIARAGFPVYLAATGSRVDRLRADGVTVNGVHHAFPVLDAEADGVVKELPRIDLVIVALKHHQLPEIGTWIPNLVSGRTAVLSVMNGIESEDSLIAAVGTEAVLPAMAAGMDAVRDESGVRFTRMGTLVFGRYHNDPDAPDERVARVQAFFSRAGIVYRTPPDMQHALWNKFMLNVGINQFSVVLRAPYGVFHRDPRARELMRMAMAEVVTIARAKNVPLTHDDLEAWFPVVETLSADGKTSMLQDIEAGRKTEVEMFAGRMVAMGEELGIPTPVNRTLLLAIQTIEAG